MKLLKSAFNFYVNSSIHVAFAVCSFVRITELYLNLSHSFKLLWVVFFGTILAYNFLKYNELLKLRPIKLTQNLKNARFFSFLCFFMMLFFGYQLRLKTVLFFIPFALLTLLYSVSFFGRSLKKLRNIPSIKILVIAFVWSGVTVLVPVINSDALLDFKALMLFLQRFLFVIVLTLPFDIRDFYFDKKQLQTVPQLIGVERTKKLGFILLITAMVIEFFITPNSYFKTVFLVMFFVLLILLQRATTSQSNYYSSFWVEGTPVIWFVLLNYW